MSEYTERKEGEEKMLLRLLVAALTDAVGEDKTIKAIYVKGLMDELTDAGRESIIAQYCECGSKDTKCQCWNDE